MSEHPEPVGDDHEQLIDELLERWEDAHEAGLRISPEDLCRDHPDLLPEIRRQIGVLQTMDRQLARQDGSVAAPAKKNLSNDSFRAAAKYGDFEELGAGGLGVVYRAIDYELNRDVAVKFLRDNHQSSYFLDLFISEAEITGRLDHPGVVPVYALGRSKSGEPFYSMRLIRGESLDQAIQEYHEAQGESAGQRWIDLRDLLQRFISVCKTIAYAHTRGILHRDIKPQNVMLGKYGETLVVDWGLALPFQRQDQFRVLDEKTLLPRGADPRTTSPDGHGTPAYMSPEQAAGNQQLTPASDIFSLGATLYKVLTGTIPFPGENAVEIKQQILDGDFEPAHVVNRQVSKAISSVCTRALQHRPEDRYPTALELAEDVERYLAGEPVSTSQDTFSRRLMRWVSQHQAAAQWIVAATVAALVLAVVTSFLLLRLADQQKQIEGELQKTLAVTRQARERSDALASQLIARNIQSELQARLRVLGRIAGSNERLALLETDAAGTLEQLQRDSAAVHPALGWMLLRPGPQASHFAPRTNATQLRKLLQQIFNRPAADTSQRWFTQCTLATVASPAQDQSPAQINALITVPFPGEQQAIGMLFSLDSLLQGWSADLKQLAFRRLQIVEIQNGELKSLWSRDTLPLDSSDQFSAADLQHWLQTEVAPASGKVVTRPRPESQSGLRSGVHLQLKNDNGEPIDCSWFVVVDF